MSYRYSGGKGLDTSNANLGAIIVRFFKQSNENINILHIGIVPHYFFFTCTD